MTNINYNNVVTKGFTPKATTLDAYLRRLKQGAPIENKAYLMKLFDNGYLSAGGMGGEFFSRQGEAYPLK